MKENEIQLRQYTAPFFRLCDTARDINLNRLCACGAILIAALILHGFRAVVMAFMGVCGAVLVELVWRAAARQRPTIFDLSAVVTGMMCAFLLPANASVWLPFFAAAFAVGVVKLPFGGFGRTPFNPEAAGYCFAAAMFATTRDIYNRALLSTDQRDIFDRLPQKYFAYINGNLPGFRNISIPDNDVAGVLSPMITLRTGADPGVSVSDFFLGKMAGPLGTTIFLLMIACAVWLYLRRSMALSAGTFYCVTVAALSFIFRWDGVSGVTSVIYELLTGATLFAAVFLVSDIFTAPHTRTGQKLYGVCCGILTIILHRVGSIEGGEIFAVLLMNACSSPIDRFVWWCRQNGVSWTASTDKFKKKLRKKLKLRSGPFDDIDLDEIDFAAEGARARAARDGAEEVRNDGHEI